MIDGRLPSIYPLSCSRLGCIRHLGQRKGLNGYRGCDCGDSWGYGDGVMQILIDVVGRRGSGYYAPEAYGVTYLVFPETGEADTTLY